MFYELTEDEAKVVARALIHWNSYLVGEYEKIAMTENVSEFIVAAARDQYNVLSNEASQLHVRLAEAFTVLKQP